MPADLINYPLASIMIGVACTWAWLLKSMIDSHLKTPRLDDFEDAGGRKPSVSVIVPARNEQHYIKRCLDSLAAQDYPDCEIIAIDDSSEDDTGGIIAEFAKKNSGTVHVSADPKPDGWMGKNWACMEGYKRATGELLLFTDSDTKHAPNIVSLAVAHLQSRNLDALTVIPRMACNDFWTRITLPMISTFLHTRFSALRVNDPSKDTGYFFGSFFIIKRGAYNAVGAHEGVRQEIIEDGALGKKIKESGHIMRMVSGYGLLEAVWARDRSTLWHALRRLMVPLYLQNSRVAVAAFFAVAFLLFVPFVLLAYSAALLGFEQSYMVLFGASAAASAMVYAAAIIETRMLHLGWRYALLGPLGGLVVVLGFQSGLAHAMGDSAVSWRGRSYSMKDYAQNPINV